MEHFAGLDVATEESALCVMDADGEIVLEGKILTNPGAIAEALRPFARTLRRVGHEAGSQSPWLQRELAAMGMPIHCLETRNVRAALDAQRNKTDKHDARGLAQMMRAGWYKTVHIKSPESYRLRLLLANRRNLKRKFLDLENAIRQSLKAFGVKVGTKCGRGGFEAAIRELVAHDSVLAGLCDSMLRARAVLWAEHMRLHNLLIRVTREDEVCSRFMGIPGVGPVTALAFKTAVDDPKRFKKARNVGAHFGLTPRRWQSGTSIDIRGRISKQGESEVRTVLYEAASCLMTRSKETNSLKRWGQKIAKRAGLKKAVVAVARRLAVIMHAMWRDGTFFEPGETAPAPRRPKTVGTRKAAPRKAKTPAIAPPRKRLAAPKRA
ncbi:MAG: IS110 family transposase [Terricaulis sp.]